MAALAVAGGVGAGEKAWGQSEWLPTFKPPVGFMSGGSYPFGVAAGDVTGGLGGGPDGFPEIAVACGHYDVNRAFTQSPTPEPRALVRIFTNTRNWDNPADGLEPHQDIVGEFNNFSGGLYYPKTVPAEVRFAHMNDDEYLDLVVSASALDPTDPVFHPDLSTWGVYVFLWVPQPVNQFVLKSHYVTTLPVRGLAVADFDNDGLNDVAVATDLNLLAPVPMDRVYVLRNDPQDPGTLVYGADVLLSLPSADVSGDVVVGDFNRVAFGLPLVDVTSANWVDNNVSVLTNGGSFNFSPVNREAPCGDWHFTDLAVGRFTAGSTRDDVAGIISTTARVQILHSDGRGKFTFDCSQDMLDTYELNPGGEPIFNAFHGITVANINLGTKPDIIVTRPSYPTSQITFMLGKGDGRFQYVAGNPAYHKTLDPGTSPRSGMAIQVICADLNQDGLEDIVTANHDSDSVSILINSTVINPGG
ncbi:MAG TPA: VCBS repeat-containing protein [Phycisphaerales bacterium]|nr:VCBS repeat-containing protein [Phycisphaerales bacterium]